nr:hypothetical protein [Tanacetum cinerariifolium]
MNNNKDYAEIKKNSMKENETKYTTCTGVYNLKAINCLLLLCLDKMVLDDSSVSATEEFLFWRSSELRAETKVATWDDLAFKLITPGWNVKHENFCKNVDSRLKFKFSTFTLMNNYQNDDQSLSDEDIREKIYSNPLFDEEIIPMEIDPHYFNDESDLIVSMPDHGSSITSSSKIDSIFDEFAGELTLLKSFPPGIDEINCHPEKKIRLTKRLLYDNSSPHDNDSERDIPILEELLDNYSLSLPTNESYHFDIPSPYRPPAKPPDGNTGTLNIKMMGDVSDQKVPIPNLTITRVLNQDKSPDLLSHQGFEAFQPSFECPMIINGKNTPLLDVPLFHFYPP